MKINGNVFDVLGQVMRGLFRANKRIERLEREKSELQREIADLRASEEQM